MIRTRMGTSKENPFWVAFDDVLLFEELPSMARSFLGTAVQRAGNSWVQQGRVRDLAVRVTYTPRSNRIDVRGEVTSTLPVDRAFDIGLALPLDATGYAWGDDLETERTVREGDGVRVYRTVRTADKTGDLPFSDYPFSA